MSTPPLRRVKTYTATSGYVYQYYFVGERQAHLPEKPNGEAATEFIFDVTRDRHALFAFSVYLTASSVADWASRHGRSLGESERYAAAKMRLLRGFDELEATDLRQQGRQLTIPPELLEELLSELGVA